MMSNTPPPAYDSLNGPPKDTLPSPLSLDANFKLPPKAALYNEPTLKEITKDYMQTSTAHGLAQIAASKTLRRKIFWIIVLITAIGVFGLQLYNLLRQYLQYQVVVSTNIETSTLSIFPAVTVCNLNRLKSNSLKSSDVYRSLYDIDKILEQGDIFAEYDEGYYSNNENRSAATMKDDTSNNLKANDYSYDEAYQSKGRKKRQSDLYEDDPSYDSPQQLEDYDSTYKEHNIPWPPMNGIRTGDDYQQMAQDFQFEDFGFDSVSSDDDFWGFMESSTTSDLSDLVDVLKPTVRELDALGTQVKDFIIQCSFDKRKCSHNDFYKIPNGLYGNCFTFNHGKNGSDLQNTSKYGSRYGLRLTLNIQKGEYIGLFSPKLGARITVHHHDETPFPEDRGVDATPGLETAIGVKRTQIKRQKTPFPSNCTNGIDIDSGKKYTVIACQLNCLHIAMEAICKCVDKTVLGENETKCCILNRTQELCRQRLTYIYDSGMLPCDCPAACSETRYDTTVSFAKWPSSRYINIIRHQMIHKLFDNEAADFMLDDNKLNDNLVRVHIYLEDQTITNIVEVPSYTWEELVADLGGLLGLFLGFSLCSAMELCEFLATMMYACTKKKEYNSKVHNINVLPKTIEVLTNDPNCDHGNIYPEKPVK